MIIDWTSGVYSQLPLYIGSQWWETQNLTYVPVVGLGSIADPTLTSLTIARTITSLTASRTLESLTTNRTIEEI